MQNNNNKVKWVGIIIALISIGAGTITSFVWAQADTKANNIKIDTVKTEGCLPARAADKAIGIINGRFDSLEKIQKTRHDAIMTKLGEK